MNTVHYMSKNSEWETPQDLFDKLNEEFHFSLDVCASLENRKTELFIAKDSLTVDWFDPMNPGYRYCNPPYGRQIGLWVQKAYEESRHCPVVMLVPARTDTKWWGIFYDHETHKARTGIEIRFLKGRLKFQGAKSCAPFPSAIVIMKRYKE